jgi:hypothetical protein
MPLTMHFAPVASTWAGSAKKRFSDEEPSSPVRRPAANGRRDR